MKILLPAVMLVSAMPLFPHHSIAGAYFKEQETRIEGNVVEYNFKNPHAVIEIEGADPKTGMPRRWTAEWASVNRLETEHVSKDTFKAGDHVIILGNPSRTVGDKMVHIVGVWRPADNWKWGQPVR